MSYPAWAEGLVNMVTSNHQGWYSIKQNKANPKSCLSSCFFQPINISISACSYQFSCRIRRLYLCSAVRTNQWVSWIWHETASNGEAPVLELWVIWSTPSLPLLPGPLWPEVVISVRIPCMGQIELLMLDNKNWNHLTVCKQMSSVSLKNNVT